jgi:putative flippase GtrA
MALTRTMLQVVRFGAVGLLNTALGLAAIYGCMFFFGLGPELANVLGYGVGLVLGFWLNRRWTFASPRRIGDAAPRYGAVVAIAWLVNLAVVSVSARSGINPYLAQLCGVAPYTVLCFLGCRFYVFPSAAPAPAKP